MLYICALWVQERISHEPSHSHRVFCDDPRKENGCPYLLCFYSGDLNPAYDSMDHGSRTSKVYQCHGVSDASAPVLTIAAAGMIRGSEKLSVGSKIFWHPLLCLSGIFLTYLPYMTANKFPGGTVMVHLVFFAFIYGIVTAVVCFIASLMKDKKPGKIPAPYVSQFRRDNENRKDK